MQDDGRLCTAHTDHRAPPTVPRASATAVRTHMRGMRRKAYQRATCVPTTAAAGPGGPGRTCSARGSHPRAAALAASVLFRQKRACAALLSLRPRERVAERASAHLSTCAPRRSAAPCRQRRDPRPASSPAVLCVATRPSSVSDSAAAAAHADACARALARNAPSELVAALLLQELFNVLKT